MPQPDILDAQRLPAAPRDGLVTLAHVIYALHAFAVLSGVATSATVVGSFVSGLPSIVAVVLNYLKRSEVRGTWLDSHFRWQIRTFWFALLWIGVAVGLAFTLIGIPLALALVLGSGLWVIYRVVRGWLALKDRRPMPVPA
jgi:uncharacterized membrane protein